LPEEPGFHEVSWFKPGSRTFGVFDQGAFRFAFAICSELMVPEVPRTLVRKGVDVLLVPRASSAAGLKR
jgi:N-carbamoylputrescine amidase